MKGFLTILNYARPYKVLAFLNIVFNIFSIVFSLFSITLVIPFLSVLFDRQTHVLTQPAFGWSINQLAEYGKFYLYQAKQEYGPQHALLYICVLVVVMIFLKNAFRYLALFFMVPLRNYIMSDLRKSLYHHILILPLSYFSEEKKGDLISRMTSDVMQMEVAVMSSLEALFKEPLTIVFYLAALIYISPMLTLIVFVCLPVVTFFLSRVGKLLKKQSARGQAKFGDLTSLIEETLMGIRIIKAFNSQEYFRKKFNQENKLYTDINIASNRTMDGSSPISETLSVLMLAVILWIGGSSVLSDSGGITAEMFIYYITVFSQLIPPAKAFSTAYNNMQKGLASLNRIEEVLQSEEIITQKNNAQSVQGLQHNIEFRNVSFKYADEYVLKNINLTIEKGKTVALVGPSGGGKSTLTDLIPRFYDPIEGEVLLDGVSLKDYKILDLRALMGIVTQESILFNDSIYNNIAFGKEGVSGDQIEQAAKIANAHDFILQTDQGYQTNIGDRGNKLSGGQKQRISIARAVNTNPDILILDEATSALDTTSERQVQEALSNVMKNRTTIVIAHRLSTIANADVIVVLEKGQIVQKGTHAELLQQDGLYRELHSMQKILEV